MKRFVVFQGGALQVIVPMSGTGERFLRQGYTVPKFLIELEGKKIIQHVIDLFPGESDFLFICNEEHLNQPEWELENLLRTAAPASRIEAISPHKLGPVHAVMEARGSIDLSAEVVVNYCDFACVWDWPDFKDFVRQTGSAGSIPAYRGFHPHSLGKTNYAYMQHSSGWMTAIQEKQPFTTDRASEFASSGTYYFQSGNLMLEAFEHQMQQGLKVAGEFYVSLSYRYLLERKLPVSIYELQHFMQWGTPEDIAEYLSWSKTFRTLACEHSVPTTSGSIVVPMAGLGQRFIDAGYEHPKPLVQVSGESMAIQSVKRSIEAREQAFVIRTDQPFAANLHATLKESFPAAHIVELAEVSLGQALSALAGVKALQQADNSPRPLTILPVDSVFFIGECDIDQLLASQGADIIVWTTRGHVPASRNPESYGWVETSCGEVQRVNVKRAPSDPLNDPVVIGAFTFRHATVFSDAVNRMLSRNERVDGEFFIDSCINDALALGYRCVHIDVDRFISWGSPDELATFEYWQSCFHKWDSHPYALETDPWISPETARGLGARFATKVAERPKAEAPLPLEDERH